MSWAIEQIFERNLFFILIASLLLILFVLNYRSLTRGEDIDGDSLSETQNNTEHMDTTHEHEPSNRDSTSATDTVQSVSLPDTVTDISITGLSVGNEDNIDDLSEDAPSHRCQSCGEEYYVRPSTDITSCRRCGGIKVEPVTKTPVESQGELATAFRDAEESLYASEFSAATEKYKSIIEGIDETIESETDLSDPILSDLQQVQDDARRGHFQARVGVLWEELQEAEEVFYAENYASAHRKLASLDTKISNTESKVEDDMELITTMPFETDADTVGGLLKEIEERCNSFRTTARNLRD